RSCATVVGHAPVCARLALAPRRRSQRVVSDGAPVSPNRAARVPRSGRARPRRACGTSRGLRARSMTATPSQSSGTAGREARAALQRGDPLAAEAICRDALVHGRDDAAIWTLLALALRSRAEGDAEAALLRA